MPIPLSVNGNDFNKCQGARANRVRIFKKKFVCMNVFRFEVVHDVETD